MSKSKAYGYSKPNLLATNIWEVPGLWSNAFGRRMTIIRYDSKGSSGEVTSHLVIHNAFELLPKDIEWLKSLGEVRCIVAPNSFHCSDAAWMSRQFPNAVLCVPKSKVKKFSEEGVIANDTNVSFPMDAQEEIKMIPMAGTKIEETAFIHKSSKTLILCDLAFNMQPVFTGFTKWLMTWNKVGVRFGPSRLTKLLFTTDKKALVASYQKLLAEDFDRVIVNHGDVLETGGKAKLRAAVEEIFG